MFVRCATGWPDFATGDHMRTQKIGAGVVDGFDGASDVRAFLIGGRFYHESYLLEDRASKAA